MATLKLKIAKGSRINPATKQMGYAARVLTSGTAAVRRTEATNKPATRGS